MLTGIALTACFSGTAAAEDCKPLKLIATLPMQDDNGMIMVPATLGNKSTSLLLDTGGTFSMIGAHVLDALDPHPHTAHMIHAFRLANGHALDQIATIRPFALGKMEAPQFQFMVMPDGEVGPKDLDGTIAPDILANFDLDLDFANRKVNLIAPNHCPGNVVYWAKDWSEIPFRSPDHMHIELPMTLDGKSMKAELDTGSSRSFITARVAKRMFGIDAHSEGARPARASDEAADLNKSGADDTFTEAFLYKFKTLEVNGLTINNPEFMVLQDKGSSTLNHVGQMMLGMPELRQLHIYIAYSENTLYITPAGSPGNSPSAH